MPETSTDQSVVSLNEMILSEFGVALQRESRILDFGCGSGRHVYEYLDRGYLNVHGYDVRDYVNRRSPEDGARFRFDESAETSRIPYPDDFFDFIFSTSVFEHVQQQDLAYREIQRALKPGGASVHNFPAKWRPIEPHIFVPFGGVFQSYPYFRFWAALGVRNSFQRGVTASETARRNHRYARTRLNYLSGGEIERMLTAIFDRVEHAEPAFLKHSQGKSRRLRGLVSAMPALAALFRTLHTRVIFVQKTPPKAHAAKPAARRPIRGSASEAGAAAPRS